MSEQASGWGWPLNSRKAHYFQDDARSLCGRWWFTGGLDADNGKDSPDDCLSCRRKLAKIRQKPEHPHA